MPFIRPTSSVNTGSFFTAFNGTESTLSESGAWNGFPVPTIFTNPVQKLSGLAYDGGTASGTNDAIAVVNTSVFVPTTRVRITATIFTTGTIGAGEIELHFNVTFTSTEVRLYELDLGAGGVFGVVKWNGPQSDVTFCNHTAGGGAWNGSVPPVTGDKVMCERTISGGTVSFNVWHIPLSTGTPFFIWTGTDDGTVNGAIYTTGQPGMGFDNGAVGGGTNGNFAFTDYLVENF